MLSSAWQFIFPQERFVRVTRELVMCSLQSAMNKHQRTFSHPALIFTPPTIWTGEVWTQQVRNAPVWLKLGITTWETLPLSLATGLPGISRSPRRHSMGTSCPMTWRQLLLMTQVAVTGDPKGTTELDVWMWAHGCLTSSENESIHYFFHKWFLLWIHFKKLYVQLWQNPGHWKSLCKHSCHCTVSAGLVFPFRSCHEHSPFLIPFTNATSATTADTHVDIMMITPVEEPRGKEDIHLKLHTFMHYQKSIFEFAIPS